MAIATRRCLSCGYSGQMKTWLANYNFPQFVAIIGLLFYLIPGLIFIAWGWGKYKCPTCGALAKNAPDLGAAVRVTSQQIPAGSDRANKPNRAIGVLVVGTTIGIAYFAAVFWYAADRSLPKEQIGALSAYGNETRAKEQRSNQEAARSKALEAIALSQVSWKKGGFDRVLLVDMTIPNTSPYKVWDITVACIGYGKSGTAIESTTHTIYDSIDAGATKQFDDVNMGLINSQVASVSCSIVDLEGETEMQRVQRDKDKQEEIAAAAARQQEEWKRLEKAKDEELRHADPDSAARTQRALDNLGARYNNSRW